MSDAKPLTRRERDHIAAARVFADTSETLSAAAAFARYEATVQKLERELNEAHAYGYRMESERDVADSARWKAEHGDPS